MVYLACSLPGSDVQAGLNMLTQPIIEKLTVIARGQDSTSNLSHVLSSLLEYYKFLDPPRNENPAVITPNNPNNNHNSPI